MDKQKIMQAAWLEARRQFGLLGSGYIQVYGVTVRSLLSKALRWAWAQAREEARVAQGMAQRAARLAALSWNEIEALLVTLDDRPLYDGWSFGDIHSEIIRRRAAA